MGKMDHFLAYTYSTMSWHFVDPFPIWTLEQCHSHCKEMDKGISYHNIIVASVMLRHLGKRAGSHPSLA